VSACDRLVPPRLDVQLRHDLRPSDAEVIRAIVVCTGMFGAAEVEVAMELVSDKLTRGEDSDYRFVVAELAGRVVGYAAFGPIPCTVSSHDLYWIVVHPECQGRGIGRVLLEAAEACIREQGGTCVYVDTSGRDAYTPTRSFYEKSGYHRAATLEDFYAAGDPKVIYAKSVGVSVPDCRTVSE